MTSYPSHRAAQRRGTWHPSDEDATTTASCSDSYDDSDDYTTSTDVPPSRARGGEYGSHTQEGKKVGKPKSPGLKPFLVTSGYGPGCEAIIFPVSTGGRVATRHAVQQMHLTRQDDELIERVLRKANRQRDSASPTSAAHNERERLLYVDEDVGNKSLSSRSSSYSSSSSHASSQAPNMNEEGTRHHRDANNRAPQPKYHQQQVIITKADVEDRSEVAIRWWRRIQTPAAYSPDSRNVVTQEQQPLASQHQNTNLVVGAADTTRCTSAPVAATLSKDATSNTSFPDEPPPASRDVQCNTSFGWQPAGAQKDAQSNTSFRAVVSPVNAAVNTSFGSRSGVSAAVNTSFRGPSTVSAATSPPLLPTFVPPAIVPSPARRPTAAPVSAPPFAMLDDIDETQSIQSSSAQSIAPSNRGGGGAVVSPRIPSDVPPQVHYVPPIRQHVPTTPANDPLHAMSRDSFALHSQGPLSLRSPVAPSLSATPDERPRPSWADPVEGLGHTPPHATEDQTDSRSPTELDEYVVPNRKQSLAGTSNGVLGSYAHRSSFRMKREDVLQPTPQTPATASSPHVVNNSLTGNSSISVLGRQASLSSLRHQPSSSQLLLARQRSMFTAPSPNKDASASGAASSSWC